MDSERYACDGRASELRAIVVIKKVILWSLRTPCKGLFLVFAHVVSCLSPWLSLLLVLDLCFATFNTTGTAQHE